MKTDPRMLQAREIATKLDSAADDVAAKLDHVFGGNLFDLLTEARDFLAALSTATPPVDGEAKMREALFNMIADALVAADVFDGDEGGMTHHVELTINGSDLDALAKLAGVKPRYGESALEAIHREIEEEPAAIDRRPSSPPTEPLTLDETIALARREAASLPRAITGIAPSPTGSERLPGPSDFRCPRCGTMTSAIHGCPCVNPTPTGSEQ